MLKLADATRNLRIYAETSVNIGDPRSPIYGFSRSILALATLLTIVLNRPETLFYSTSGSDRIPACEGLSKASIFCLAGTDQISISYVLSILILVAAISGWRPQLTCIPHWYIAWSLLSSITILDGGDQVAAILSLCFVFVHITDRRKWHWNTSHYSRTSHGATVAAIAIVAIKIQMSIIYFQSGVAKLSHAVWSDGTAMYYWFRESGFGSPHWLRWLTDSLTDNGVVLAALTWLPLILELALSVSLLIKSIRARLVLLFFGVVFHAMIALFMGLPSFALAMWSGLIVLLIPLSLSSSTPASIKKSPSDLDESLQSL